MLDSLSARLRFLVFVGVTAFCLLADVGRATSAPSIEGAEPGTYAQAVLGSAPLAYWRLDESAGPTARDATGHGNDARYLGHPHFRQRGAIRAEPGLAVGLNGPLTRSYLEVRDREDFSIATSGKGMSVEVWMRPDALDFKGEAAGNFVHWLGKGEKGQQEWGFRFYARRSDRPNRISAYAWNPDGKLGAGAYVDGPLTAGAWVHLVATFDDPRQPNARVCLFKNGQPSPHNSSPGTLYKNYHILPRHGQAPVRLGTRDLRSYLTGGLDEIAIYPRVLPPDEILLHWKVSQRR